LENEIYQRNVERIKQAYPDKEFLTQADVAKFCGIDVKTVVKYFPFKQNRISVASLANHLSV
jgi:hypothetical protein